MKITLLSDTHNKHAKLKLSGGDMIIHAGDISSRGHTYEVKDFMDWFSALPYTYKIVIAGNHDFFFERKDPETVQKIIPPDVIYLNDSGCRIEGINFWGSPVQPWFYDWAFNRQRGDDIKRHWDLIPDHTDVLITHGPPYGILDKTKHNEHVGCEELLKAVNKIKPRLHIFGHIHEANGKISNGTTDFYNASVLDENYLLVNDPFEVELNINRP